MMGVEAGEEASWKNAIFIKQDIDIYVAAIVTTCFFNPYVHQADG